MKRLSNYLLAALLLLAFGKADAQVCGALIDTSDLVYHPYEVFSVVASRQNKNEVVFTIRAVREIEFCGLTAEDLKGLHAHHSDHGGCAISDTAIIYETYTIEKGVPVLQTNEAAAASSNGKRWLADRHLEQFLSITKAEGFRQNAFRQFNQDMRDAHQGILKARNDAKQGLPAQKKAAGGSHDHTSDVIH